MTLPAFQLLERCLSSLDSFPGNLGFGWNFDGRPGFFAGVPGREMLDVGYHVCPLLLRQRTPLRHIGIKQSAADGVIQIFIGWQSSRRRGPASKRRAREIPRPGLHPLRVLARTVSQRSVAADAIPLIGLLAVLGAPRQFANVAFHPHLLALLVLRRLTLGNNWQSKEHSQAYEQWPFH